MASLKNEKSKRKTRHSVFVENFKKKKKRKLHNLLTRAEFPFSNIP
jgi:hypothetical protein